ncbi:hypothetical protein PMIN04_012010 [Paraphaeosphaeria minitans]|uniref:Uncharacterized protein n=1 Tax=Paraphaeosphaeria minitans TaxID=565426 RepID=A0A9P6G7C3_9PLEO|nr:hypothetical protein PMIN01_12147 [Paraphaeosphaeria minitans]
MPSNSSSSGTNGSNTGRVGTNPQPNGNDGVTIRDDQSNTSGNAADSSPPARYTTDFLDDPAGTRTFDLSALYDNPQTNGNDSKT